MDLASLDEQIADLTSALGDPTRRGIYVAIRESAEPMTAGEIAELFGIHPNVARHHLDKLAADGWLVVSHRRPAGKSGPGAGRPAKTYEASKKEISIHFSPQVRAPRSCCCGSCSASPTTSAGSPRRSAEYGELAAEIGAPRTPPPKRCRRSPR